MSVEGASVAVRDQTGREHRVVLGTDGTVTVGAVNVVVHSEADGTLRIIGARNTLVWTVVAEDLTWVFADGNVYTFEVELALHHRRRATAHHASLMAPMPATVRKVTVAAGDTVRRGDVLIVLEAMKMELPIRATAEGRVTAIHCREGELVQPGVTLIEVED